MVSFYALFTLVLRIVHSRTTICSLRFTNCSLSFHELFTLVSLSFHGLFTLVSRIVHSRFTNCLLTFHSRFTNCLLSSHGLFTNGPRCSVSRALLTNVSHSDHGDLSPGAGFCHPARVCFCRPRNCGSVHQGGATVPRGSLPAVRPGRRSALD